MKIKHHNQMSRLKKKLQLYFLLIAIVWVSVSAEIILDVSSRSLQNSITHNFTQEIKSKPGLSGVEAVEKEIDYEKIFWPVYDLRNRMILLLLVVTGCIVAAFFMFARDIVGPMDGMVDATKKIAEGDLTVQVPVMSADEIGQIGSLINEMNVRLLDMINQVKMDIRRHKDKVRVASSLLSDLIPDEKSGEIVETRKMKVSEFKGILKNANDIVHLLEMMTTDLSSLETFVNMYKTYKIKSEISQNEIQEAIESYNRSTGNDEKI
jgi:methyl-accepting chemotaxis protein